MNIFKSRPLALACCVSALAAVLLSGTESVGKLFLLSLLLTGLLALLFLIRYRRRCGARTATVLLCLLLSFATLLASWSFFDLSADVLKKNAGTECDAEGYVLERVEDYSWGTVLNVRLSELGGAHTDVKVRLECEYISSLRAGDCFRLRGVVPEKQKFVGDGCVGILRCGNAGQCTVLPERKTTFRMDLANRSASLSDLLTDAVGGEEGALASALLLGNRSGLSSDSVLRFRRAGISHLLALSGLHVTALLALAEFLLRLMRVPKILRAVLIPSSAVFYLLLTGCAVSTLRAVLMICVLYLGFLFRESYDPFTALCVILTGILFFSPDSVTDISLWMSFLSAGAILLFLPVVRTVLKEKCGGLPAPAFAVLRWIVSALAVGIFANAAVLVLSAVWFGSTSVFSVPVTMLLSPILPVALAGCTLSLLFPYCRPIIFLTRRILRFMLVTAERISAIPNGTILLNGTVTVILLLGLGISMLVIAVVKLRNRGWLFVPVALSVAVLISGYAGAFANSGKTIVNYRCNKWNEFILIGEGTNVVIFDCSDGSVSLNATISEALLEAGYTELRELIFTHYHSGMSARIASLSARMRITAVRMPEPLSEREAAIAARLEQEARSHGISVCYGNDDLPIPSVEILRMERCEPSYAEAPVLMMLRVRGKILTYLGSGALRLETEGTAENAVLSADVLILGTHGASSGTTPQPLRISKETGKVICASNELAEFYALPKEDPRVISGVGSDHMTFGDP